MELRGELDLREERKSEEGKGRIRRLEKGREDRFTTRRKGKEMRFLRCIRAERKSFDAEAFVL